ncbi:MAG TPA: rhomboid family intramembrane serine protease [Saprospiraceae bacterium]|nr:rhomboid family intramembrane serine protease [Saprospiraceae bacterium]
MKLKFNSPVILGFSLACVAVFILDKLMVGHLMSSFRLEHVSLSDPMSVLTLFTHVLGHVSWDHLIGNLTFILLVGPIVEEKYGAKLTLLMILFTAFMTGIFNILFFHTGLLGASGIVFMLILLASFTNSKHGEIPITFILIALLFIGKEVVQSLSKDQISQFAHIMGGICGSVFGFVMRPGRK